MKNKITKNNITEWLEKYGDSRYEITDEEIKEVGEYMNVCNTPKSPSLNIIREAGFNPIGICGYACEETFLFNTQEEATKAYNTLERDENGYFIGKVMGWWYGFDSLPIIDKELGLRDLTLESFKML